ncbi:hypothetical protein BDZ90DRAFT_9207 [Jaminaea rosea]|uniref:Uncharacterized protein n=1 Tax=Jaminaea rosea TaxID=1569628 RepID=A0A316V286_9BASI|nr:hypothetical protein BDZ90DRAFT_9207 [Jaminaea rosea]PWN30293.1 hypothetical protein BDZ90DRAFT_9207 [Jaminaea rosea]
MTLSCLLLSSLLALLALLSNEALPGADALSIQPRAVDPVGPGSSSDNDKDSNADSLEVLCMEDGEMCIRAGTGIWFPDAFGISGSQVQAQGSTLYMLDKTGGNGSLACGASKALFSFVGGDGPKMFDGRDQNGVKNTQLTVRCGEYCVTARFMLTRTWARFIAQGYFGSDSSQIVSLSTPALSRLRRFQADPALVRTPRRPHTASLRPTNAAKISLSTASSSTSAMTCTSLLLNLTMNPRSSLPCSEHPSLLC